MTKRSTVALAACAALLVPAVAIAHKQTVDDPKGDSKSDVDIKWARIKHDDKTVSLIAGGQSLLVLLSLRMAPVDLLVDIGRIDELKTVSETSTHVFIGAATTHATIEDGGVPDPSGFSAAGCRST